jgi:ribonuclease HII
VSGSLSQVCGLDEAGRGALAGPIVIAAVVLDAGADLDGEGLVVRDSKMLTPGQRQRLYECIVERSLEIGIEVIAAPEIDANGINWANISGFRRLIQVIDADAYFVDGRWSLGDLGRRATLVECRIRADQTVPATLAAGIVAKVTRDSIMLDLDACWPRYGWATNTGHGTAAHIKAIRRHGVTREHRRQFVATALANARRRTTEGLAASRR